MARKNEKNKYEKNAYTDDLAQNCAVRVIDTDKLTILSFKHKAIDRAILFVEKCPDKRQRSYAYSDRIRFRTFSWSTAVSFSIDILKIAPLVGIDIPFGRQRATSSERSSTVRLRALLRRHRTGVRWKETPPRWTARNHGGRVVSWLTFNKSPAGLS